MTTTIRLIGAFFVALCLAFALPSEDVLAQNNRGSLKGKPSGRGGGSSEIPLIIVFRDATGDLLRSDSVDGQPAPYIAGDPGIARAAFDDAGEVRLGFSQSKGKNPTSGRHLVVDLSGTPEVPLGPRPPKFNTEAEINAFFHISADGDGVGVRDLLPDGSLGTNARFPIFSERKSDWEGWKLSFSDNILGDVPDNRVTVSCVERVTGGPCRAWMVEKELYGKTPRAALVGGGTNEEPDAGIWVVPFGIAVCLYEEFKDSPPSPGEACLMRVGVLAGW